MAVLIDHQPVNVPPGTREFGPVSVPDGLTRITIRVARQTTATPTFWGAGVFVNALLFISLDGGATYLGSCGAGAIGGIHVLRVGGEAPETTASCGMPPGVGRLAKATLTVSGGTLVSKVTAEAT